MLVECLYSFVCQVRFVVTLLGLITRFIRTYGQLDALFNLYVPIGMSVFEISL